MGKLVAVMFVMIPNLFMISVEHALEGTTLIFALFTVIPVKLLKVSNASLTAVIVEGFACPKIRMSLTNNKWVMDSTPLCLNVKKSLVPNLG